jgi:hypothetical protein
LKAFKGFQANLSTETQSKESPCIGLFSAKLENGFYTEEGVWMSELEFKVLHFMETSGNPFSFPTQSQLLEAGRGDLVEAILHEGGWLASGWDSNSRASTDKVLFLLFCRYIILILPFYAVSFVFSLMWREG